MDSMAVAPEILALLGTHRATSQLALAHMWVDLLEFTSRLAQAPNWTSLHVMPSQELLSIITISDPLKQQIDDKDEKQGQQSVTLLHSPVYGEGLTGVGVKVNVRHAVNPSAVTVSVLGVERVVHPEEVDVNRVGVR
jgi:hypothetical protein